MAVSVGYMDHPTRADRRSAPSVERVSGIIVTHQSNFPKQPTVNTTFSPGSTIWFFFFLSHVKRGRCMRLYSVSYVLKTDRTPSLRACCAGACAFLEALGPPVYNVPDPDSHLDLSFLRTTCLWIAELIIQPNSQHSLLSKRAAKLRTLLGWGLSIFCTLSSCRTRTELGGGF